MRVDKALSEDYTYKEEINISPRGGVVWKLVGLITQRS